MSLHVSKLNGLFYSNFHLEHGKASFGTFCPRPSLALDEHATTRRFDDAVQESHNLVCVSGEDSSRWTLRSVGGTPAWKGNANTFERVVHRVASQTKVGL